MSENRLGLVGIYPDGINDAIETAIDVADKYDLHEQTLHNMAEDYLKECGDFGDITNSIIAAYFVVTADLLRQKKPDIEVDYYVNGTLDSHFYIDGEEA